MAKPFLKRAGGKTLEVLLLIHDESCKLTLICGLTFENIEH